MTDITRFLKPQYSAFGAEEALRASVEVLDGVSPQAAERLRRLDIREVFDLALSRLFCNALRISGTDDQPADTILRKFGRPPRDMVDSGSEPLATAMSAKAPLLMLEGVGRRNGPQIAEALQVSTIRDLANWKPFTAARAILQAVYDDPAREENLRLADQNHLLQDDLSQAKMQAAVAVGDLQACQAKLTETEARYTRLQIERDQLQLRLKDAESRLAAAGTATLPADDTGPLSIGSFAARIGGEIDSAQTALKERGFSLGAITVNSKAVFQPDGMHIRLPERDELQSLPSAALSDIAIQYTPTAPTAGNDVLVPDVRQLTESAARRVLASVGLPLDPSHGQPGMGVTAAEGQAMLQSPVAGDRVARGSHVLVIFARSTS